MAVFVKQDGKLIPFNSAEEARAFQTRGQPEAPAPEAAPAPTPAASAAGAVAPTAPALGGNQLPPEVPVEGTTPPHTEPLPMIKNGRIRKIPPENIGRAREMGWATATEGDIEVAREKFQGANPFGNKSPAAEIGNSLVAGAEAAASTLIAPLAAVQGTTGHEVIAGAQNMAMQLFGEQLSVEQSERRVRYRAQAHETAAFVGEMGAYIGLAAAGGAALAAGAGAAGAGAALGSTAGQLATGFAGNAAMSNLALREDAWVHDREITATDIVSTTLIGGLIGIAAPAGGVVLRKGAEGLKNVFGAAKKLKPGALAGEAENAAVGLAEKAGVDTGALRSAGERSRLQRANAGQLEVLGVSPQEYSKGAAMRSPNGVAGT